MGNKLRWLLGVSSIVFLGNFAVLLLYGDTLRSTHLFIVRGTVFYPVAYLNLVLGIIVFLVLVVGIVRKQR